MMIRPLLLASTVLLLAPPARAERPHEAVTLTYLPSPATVALCPEADFIAVEVQIRLGYELFQKAASNHLTVKVQRESGRFRAIGEIRDDEGKVIFAEAYTEIDCTAAIVSMAIMVAVKFTKAPEEPETPPPSPPEPSPPEPEPEPPPVLPPVAPVAPPDPPKYQAGLASVLSTGTAPTVVGGIGGFVGVRWPKTSLALEGRVLFAPLARLEHGSMREGYHFSYSGFSGTACHQPGWFFACARAEVGSISFGNADVMRISAHMMVLSLGTRFGGDLKLSSSIALRAYFELLGQPLSGRLYHDVPENPSIWESQGFSGSIGFGPVFTFSGI